MSLLLALTILGVAFSITAPVLRYQRLRHEEEMTKLSNQATELYLDNELQEHKMKLKAIEFKNRPGHILPAACEKDAFHLTE